MPTGDRRAVSSAGRVAVSASGAASGGVGHRCMGGSVVEFSPATREARVRFPANAAGRPFAELHRPPGRGDGGGERAGSGEPARWPAAFGVCARSRRRAQCFEGAESKTARQGRRTDGAGGRLDLPRPGVGGKVARAGGMEALGSAGAGEGLAPTLPGGLVVRIRRSHRRGPGSIPGQGKLSFSSVCTHTSLSLPCTHTSLSLAAQIGTVFCLKVQCRTFLHRVSKCR